MKILAFVAILVLLTTSTLTSAQEKNLVKIKIEGLKSDLGGVELILFNKANESHYPIHPEHAAAKEYKTLNNGKSVDFVFTNLPEGEYAAFAYHDEDANKKINTNFMHIPTEGYGATNGAKNRFGPPKYADARFVINFKNGAENTVPLKIEY